MTATFEVSALQRSLYPLCEQQSLRLILVFGSTVTGLRGPETDVDLALSADAPLYLVTVTTEVLRSLHTDRVDVVDLRRASPLLAMEVARHGRLLYERTPGLHAAFISPGFRRSVDTKKLRMSRKTPSIDSWLPKSLP